MDVVVTEQLVKRYGHVTVLHGIDLRVPRGALFGFLGPNGAGKTTTLRILLGLLRASDGRARVLDREVWKHGAFVRGQIGYLPGDVRFYDNLTGRATLRYLDAARRTRADAEIRRLTERFDLDLDKRVRQYSRGMKQKLGLIQALMHRPALLILDEPTTALDPLMREQLYAELRDVAADGRTVLFSSHTLSEVEALCDRVAILRAGRLIEQERIDVLRERAVRRVEVSFKTDSAAAAAPNDLHVLHHSDGRLVGTWSGPIEPLIGWLSRAPIRDVTIAPPDLEDLFMAYYSDRPEVRA